MQTKIMITHLSGTKENQIEQLRLDGLNEVVLGRDPSATVVIDAKDDVAGRRHAAIKIYREIADEPRFTVVDLGSQNGTFLNGERITQESELMPGDTIQLGQGGPQLGFDLQPLPVNFSSRTRVARTPAAAAATRIGAIPAAPASPSASRPAEPMRGVGHETVQRLLTDERKSHRRAMTYSIAGILALVAVTGGGLYFYSKNKQAAAQAQINTIVAENSQPKPFSSADLAKRYGNSTVIVNLSWRLYDSDSNQPLYQKTVQVEGGDRVAAYIQLPNGKTVRWLTTASDDGANTPIGEDGQGSGFVATSDGVIITNKHVAAGWMVSPEAGDLDPHGVVITLDSNLNPITDKHDNFVVSSLSDDAVNDLLSWVPANGGLVFDDQNATVVGNGVHSFEGRDNALSVQFPGQSSTTQARLISASDAADAALIKIDTGHPLLPIPLAPTNNVSQADAVTVMGYPAVTPGNTVTTTVNEAGATNVLQNDVPSLTVTDGIVSVVGKPATQIGATTVQGDMGEVDQLSDNATGQGNSGGPVFNSAGQVIGIFTYTRAAAGASVTFAVPIHFAQDLLNPSGAN